MTTVMLTKGTYFVSGISLYYVLDQKPKLGMLLVENCWTNDAKWIKAHLANKAVREVIKTK